MAYQTINPFTEKLVTSFREHTDAQLEAIIAKAEEIYEKDWSLSLLSAGHDSDISRISRSVARRDSASMRRTSFLS